ncbi:MAG: Alpha,4-glucan:maltose-phosphate maltosyltransferase 2 [Verrucomicrobiota bacterium]
MTPAPGERLVRFVGDQLSFRLGWPEARPLPEGWQGRLRTNLGRGEVLRREIIAAHSGRPRLPMASWRDVPLVRRGDGGWELSLALTEPGFFKAKAYALDPEGRQHWPEGPDFGVSVHPDAYRTANTIYCAFPRMFGRTKALARTVDEPWVAQAAALDGQGFTVIPPSGKLRELTAELPHIVDRLGCRILHLLPITPTPTTLARFGRFGSPYAVQDLLAIDPALVEFDRRTTAVDQFRELAHATHARGARLFLDVVINHTGWGSTLQERHPEWYLRDAEGAFVSPGAWGVVWEDLAELDHRNAALWEHMADVFIEWCRRGVDGFRCDAGYKIPVPAWRYITARVQDEFPETIFLLEGLGGSWEATENLLTEGAMQWAYSELFQNHSHREVADYLDYALRQSARVGLYVHYSETHDNTRLAAVSREWSLLRNRLCALTSVSGAFGFTSGVEWLADEKLNVHSSRGLRWGEEPSLVGELGRLNRLLADHPCFFDNARLTRLSRPEDHVLALSRVSADGRDRVLVLVNTDPRHTRTLVLDRVTYGALGAPSIDLLEGGHPPPVGASGGTVEFHLPPGAAACLATAAEPVGPRGDDYRQRRAQSAWAITQISRRIRVRDISPFDWGALAALVAAGPARFLAAVSRLEAARVRVDVLAALREALEHEAGFPPVVTWTPESVRRVTPIPRDHWLLVEDDGPFRVVLDPGGAGVPEHLASVRVGDRHVASFAPGHAVGEATLRLERYGGEPRALAGGLWFVELPAETPAGARPDPQGIVLLTNGRGGMARLAVDLGRIFSKYDCLLGANLHPAVPVDRHILAKRMRVWINADGFITPLNLENLAGFTLHPVPEWRFVATAGDDRAVEVVLTADMPEGINATVLRFQRPAGAPPFGRALEPGCRVSLTVRVDVEDRNFHGETHRQGGAEHHFGVHTRTLRDAVGFEFHPVADRRLRVTADAGVYHPQPEWSEQVPHPVEASRGQVGQGDAYSPGWFELPLEPGAGVTLAASAEPGEARPEEMAGRWEQRQDAAARALKAAGVRKDDAFGRDLALAVRAFVARRDQGRTIIAGYPWFLDWGRDSLICARGLLAAGGEEEVRRMLQVFARFEEDGTLPNTIHGEDASNRDTSDAPLWFGVACEELAEALPRSGAAEFLAAPVDARGRTVADVLRSIAEGCRDGTPNGIRMDPESGLLWSPSHFTWMDTNHPAGTPREGYPVEIQALWIRLLRQVAQVGPKAEAAGWQALANQATRSLETLFWLEPEGWLADVLLASAGQPAAAAVPDHALRSNALLAVTLGLVTGARARRCVAAALRHLVVPGALRSLAPLPARPPLPIHGPGGQLLNDPLHPYWGRYEGDEDTRRKPAYHNGTAWTWTFPVFCEALARAWDFEPSAVAAARVYLGTMQPLLHRGCLGHLPEILDGDAPHAQRGCDAQAWGATEALRVWKLLQHPPRAPGPPAHPGRGA